MRHLEDLSLAVRPFIRPNFPELMLALYDGENSANRRGHHG